MRGVRLRAASLVVSLDIGDFRWLEQAAQLLDSRAPRAGLSDAEHALLRIDSSGIALAVSRDHIEPLRTLLAGARFFLTLDGYWPTAPADGDPSRAS